MIEPQEEHMMSVLTTSVKRGNKHDVGAWVEVLSDKLPFDKVGLLSRRTLGSRQSCRIPMYVPEGRMIPWEMQQSCRNRWSKAMIAIIAVDRLLLYST